MPNKLTQSDFIERCKAGHNNKYDYSQVQYINTMSKIKIICNTHGMFEQVAKLHLRGDGCTKCKIETIASKKRTPLYDLINQFHKIHNMRYDYTLVNYVNTDTLIKIICPIHGTFEVTPYRHLRGQECKHCKKNIPGSGGYTSGYFITHPTQKNVKASLYIAHFTDSKTNENFYKVGITSRTAKLRLNIAKQYSKQIVEEYQMPLLAAFELEQEILKSMQKYQYQPKYKIGGWTECLIFNQQVFNEIKSLVKSNRNEQHASS